MEEAGRGGMMAVPRGAGGGAGREGGMAVCQ